MKMFWLSGFALAGLMGLTALASAQDRKDFFKKAFEAKRGGSTSEADRAKAELKSLEEQIARLKAQIGEASSKLAKLQGASKQADGQKKFGPPDGKGGPPWARGGDKKPEPQAKGQPWGKGPPDGKGGPPWARDGDKKFGPPSFGPPGFGRGPTPTPWGRPDMSKWTPKGPPTPATSSGRGRPSDLESRVSRLERAVEELRREVRYRR